MNLRGRTLTTLMALALVALIAVSGVGAQAKKQITFASRDFVETAIIAEIVKRLVEEKTDIEVRHLPNIEFRVTVAAMQTGDIDAYSSYSGSQFTTVLGQEVTEEWRDPKKVLEYCKVEMDRRFNMKLFDPLGFDNTYAIAVRRDFAEKHNLEKVSDLVPLAPNLTIATDADFLHREEVMSFTNFTRTYGLKFKKAVAMTYGLMYRAAYVGDVDVIMAYSSDGRIAAMDLKLLEDDLQFFPPYDAILIVRNETLAKYPELEPVLNLLTGRIDQEAIQRMNARADVEGHDLKVIAEDFLKEQGLI
ncbi:MAG: glycine betaine ABC transporter substrate-binding protein [Bacillota bacterium]|jgi:glycine betaine/choline ABC-type transport system substrate-binding protein|nr:hypothetical protein [Bacillota bacterium]